MTPSSSRTGVSGLAGAVQRNGVRIGGGHHAQLVQPVAADSIPTDDERQRLRRIDALYREWTRDRADVERLRRLHEAITDCLEDSCARMG